MKTPTDRLSRAVKSRARLRQWSLDAFAASIIDGGMSRSAPAKTRVLEVFYAPHPPKGGFGMHLNITHRALCAARCSQRCAPLLVAGRSAHRPHNVRYAEVHAQRAKTLAVESGEAPQSSSPAHPLKRCSFARNRCALPVTSLRTRRPQGAPCFSCFADLASPSVACARCAPRRAAFAVCLMSVAPCSPRQGQVNGRRRPPLTRLRSMRVGPADSARRERWANRRSS